MSVSDKVNAAIKENGWSALVVLGVENMFWSAGAWIPNAKGYLDRQNIVVWPAQGEVSFITGEELISGTVARNVDKFVGYEENGALPPAVIADTVAETLRKSGVSRGWVGIDMLRLPVPFLRRLEELLPEVEWASADEALRRMRMVKTELEIDWMRQAARFTDEAVWDAFQAVSAGQTEKELSTEIQSRVIGNGCDLVTTVFLGTGERAGTICTPGEVEMKPGDLVRFDLNSTLNGYFCDIGRMAVVGEPSEEQAASYAGHIELRRRIFEYIRPGVRCSEVHSFYVRQAEDLGLKRFIYPYIGIGHGTGVNNDEYPKLNGVDPTRIEAGMVLNVEPDTFGPNGEVMHVEDMLLVKDDGVEVLTWTKDWSQLPVISA